MTVRNVKKNLAAQQDMLPGLGPYNQTRRGLSVTVDGPAKSYIELWKDYCGDAYVGTFEDGFSAVKGDIAVSLVLGKAYVCNVASVVVVANSSPTAAWIELDASVPTLMAFEALRRSYANVGYTLVSGSFQAGCILTSATAVALDKVTGKAFSGAGPFPQTVPARTNPTIGGYTDRSGELLREQLAAVAGSKLVGLPHGNVYDAIKYLAPEMFWLAGDADDTNSWFRCIDYATLNGLNIEAHGRYEVSDNLLIKQVANIPPVSRDFTRITVNINYMKFTGYGACITNRSPAVVLNIGELEGATPFTGPDQTIGLQLMDTHLPLHRIGYVHGFATNVKFQDAYGASVWLGECDDASRGVRGDNSNACRVFGSIGGRFSTAAIDPTTCLVGFEWTSTCAANEVFATVEYCRRDVGAKAFIDVGASNKYYGYSESCHTASSLDGKYCNYDLFNGGDNVRSAAGYYAGGVENHIKLLKASTSDGASVTPTNSSLTFKNLQPMQSSTPQSSVSGPGFSETLGAGKTAQLIKNSNEFTTASWDGSYTGGFAGASVAFGKYGAGETSRYIYGTQLTFAAAVANETQFYRVSQTLSGITFGGHISLGIALRCVTGDVDIFVKLQGITSGKVYSIEHRLTAGSKVIELWHSCPSAYGATENYVFEIQFRPWAASIVQVYNTHACASPNVRRAPASIAANVTNFVQRVDEDKGINVRHSVAPSAIITLPLSLYQYDFDTYIMPNLTGNIILAGDGYDGQRVTFVKPSGASANLLSAKLINGASSYPMTTAYSAVTVMFSAEFDTWFVVA